jgi:uncharacterized protein
VHCAPADDAERDNRRGRLEEATVRTLYRVATIAAAAAAAVATETHAASFDCGKARSATEKLICGDPQLSRMDDELAGLYAKAKASAPDKAAFEAYARRRWQEREEGCNDVVCLRMWYANRRQELAGAPSSASAGTSSLAALRAEMMASRAERERLQAAGSPTRTPMQILAAPRDDEVLRITSSRLEVEYESNELAVEQKMKGKGAIEVTGQVLRVTRDEHGDPLIVVAALNNFQAFHLFRDQEAVESGLPASEPRAAELRAGQMVTIRCALVTRPLIGHVVGGACFMP